METGVQKSRKRSRGVSSWALFVIALAIVALSLSVSGAAVAAMGYGRQFSGRIYPDTSVWGIALGGLTVDEAAAVLRAELPDAGTLPLVLRSGDRAWPLTWAHLGLHFDPLATARLAYQVGRDGSPREQYAAQLRARLGGWQLAPVVVLPNSQQAQDALQSMAPELAVPAVNAGLLIQPEGITPVPAQAGRELDIQETVSALPHAIRCTPEGLVVELLTRQVEPSITNPGAAQAQAEQILSQPLMLSGSDRLTGFNGTWSIPPSEMAGWLTVHTVEDENGARLALTVEEPPVQAYLESLNPQLAADGIAIDVGVTTHQVRAAVEAGESQAIASLVHPPRIHIVQPGDTMMSLARQYGFPVWRLLAANPDIDAEALRPGQEVTIPSVDVLLPEPLVLEQRIAVDISEQRLRAYENDVLVYDFIASTGIDSSPTMPGTYQVLSKEEDAYASVWDLHMPHFISVYYSAPGFANGIHGLPTLSSGARLWDGYLGRPVSYGCIILGLDEAAALYAWAQIGALVTIQE